MTTKTEPTNEQMLLALGWTKYIFRDGIDFAWVDANGDDFRGEPDVLNDLNASWKYVWPALKKEVTKNNLEIDHPYIRLREIAFMAIESPNPAMYFAIKFIRLHREAITIARGGKLKGEQ